VSWSIPPGSQAPPTCQHRGGGGGGFGLPHGTSCPFSLLFSRLHTRSHPPSPLSPVNRPHLPSPIPRLSPRDCPQPLIEMEPAIVSAPYIMQNGPCIEMVGRGSLVLGGSGPFRNPPPENNPRGQPGVDAHLEHEPAELHPPVAGGVGPRGPEPHRWPGGGGEDRMLESRLRIHLN